MSTCPADKSREQPELSNSDRQLQFEAARQIVIQLIGNMDAKIDSAHDIQILTGVLQNREGIIATQLETIKGFQELVSHHQGMANVMDNQVATIIKLKKQLSQKNSVDMPMLEKDKHLGEKAERIEVLQNIKQVKDRQLQVKDRLLQMKGRQLQMKDRQLQAWQSKFTAMHHNATLLAREVAKQDLMLTALKDSETKAQALYVTQKEVVNASIALANRDRKTKFVMAHTVTYAVTAPTADVYDEVSAAARRQLEEFRQAKMEEIATLAQKVEVLARVYSPHRYNSSYPTNESAPKVVDDVDNLLGAVPVEFYTIWMCQQGEVELTPEEEQKFTWFLAQQIRPPPIYSPTLKKPRVDWTKVNKWQFRNLPDPGHFAIQSAPQDPTYYTSKHPGFLKYGSIRGCVGRAISCGCVRCDPPFGMDRGLMTNHGVLSMPTEPVHGHVWNGNEWVLYAGY